VVSHLFSEISDVFLSKTRSAMPTVFRSDGIKYFFYSNEGQPREPLHIHVLRGSAEAKIWLQPTIGLAWNSGFRADEIRAILDIVRQRKVLIENAWHGHFSN
jgi:diadenosine tetraphosphate (Ap4A) HIT family hydrolase